MVSHIQDRWYRVQPNPDKPGKVVRVPTNRHGRGGRYKARFVAADGRELSRTFADGQLKLAKDWLAKQRVDSALGVFIDPRAGKVAVRDYAERWIGDLDIDEMSRETLETRFRARILPELGSLPIGSVSPSDIRSWDRRLRDAGMSDRYRHTLFTNLSALFLAAQDDGLIAKNPFGGKSLKKPRPSKDKVKPWPDEQVWAMQSALPPPFRILIDLTAGLGLRQGECFGLSLEDVDFLRGVVHVRRQVKTVRYKRVFALPKYDKEREIPLSEPVKIALAEHLRMFPPQAITLPWNTADGNEVAVKLIVTSMWRRAVAANDFNRNYWKPALEKCGIPTGRYQNGMHELRHFFASALLEHGVSIKAVAEWLGHTDPSFTLATYTHLMPSSDSRTKAAISTMYEQRKSPHGPTTAQTSLVTT